MSDQQTDDQGLSPTLVRASAGTGKTYQLTARFLKLLFQGVPPETVLATTFTRKAAGEILNRILHTLATAASESRPEALEEIRKQVGLATLPSTCCLQLTEKLLLNIHRLRVSTLDSLFTQLAKSFPYELKLPATWRLSDEIEEVWLRERAVGLMITQLDRAEIATLMSMLGKGEIRRSVAGELIQVIETAYSKQRSCSSKVWSHIKAPKKPDDSKIRDAIDGFRSAQPKQKRLREKLEKFAEILESDDADALLNETLIAKYRQSVLRGEPLTYYRSEFPPGLDEAFKTLYEVAKNRHLSLLQMQNEGTGQLLQAYESHIRESKEELRVLSFEDISVRLSELFRDSSAEQLLNRMDGVVDHLLLDEFQDTSPTQWQVLYPFALRTTQTDCVQSDQANRQETGVSRSFFCVGDTKQAIYGWRGGVAEIFDTVAQQLKNIDELKQDKSYRSSPVLMDFVSRVFKNLTRHSLADDAKRNDLSDKSMYEARALIQFAERFPIHLSAKESLRGYVQFSTAPLPEEADQLARRTATFQKAAGVARELLSQDPSLSIGILTRTNRAVAELIYLLETAGLEVSQEGGNPLTDSAAVEMVLSALMMAEHPGDRRWEFHLTGGPLSKIEGFNANWVRRHVDEYGLPETIEMLASHLAPCCDERETLRLKQLAYLAIDYDLHTSPRLRDFVRLVREKRVDRPRPAPVRVMTVHQAKGLEFDAVIVVELDGDLARQSVDCVPQIESLMQPPIGLTRYTGKDRWHFLSRDWQKAFGKQAADSFTESLCMWYVAITRAKQGLYMIVTPSKKSDYTAKNFGSLLFHALDVKNDPTVPDTTLLETGDPNWFDQTRASRRISELPEVGGVATKPTRFAK